MTVVRRALAAGEPDHEVIWLTVGVALVFLGAVVQTGFAPFLFCPLKLATGWPCAGCGATRALAALSRGSVGVALRANPLVTAVGVAWVAWGCHALVMILSGAPRVRVRLSPRELIAARWAAILAVAGTWLFLIADGR